jgi:diphosphomevalonate decarboxylase
MAESFFWKKASFLARLGSGSACRSIRGELVQWGSHPGIKGSSDLYGIPYPYEVHPVFKNYRDAILLIDVGQKQVSSSVGHKLMQDHPFADQRFKQANENLGKLRDIFATGDLESFVKLVELEALTLHAMMMTGMPNFLLMKPGTLRVIAAIRDFRKRTGTMACFTLDAGANVHLLYPEAETQKVQQFIKEELVVFCENGQYLCDRLGSGARKANIIA